MLPSDLRAVLADQSGVLARSQVLAAGSTDPDVDRWLRRRELVRLHRGVFVDHTGAPTQEQLRWAAVLACWPAALYGESALEAHGLRTARASPVVLVAVDHSRRGHQPAGVRVRRVAGLDGQVQWNLAPPRQTVEHAVLAACAAAPTRSDAFAIAADAVGQRRTTAPRLLAALDERARMTHGAWLRRVLHDVADGAQSFLEWGYLHRVERAHGLPRARRQSRVEGAGSTTYRDADYPEHGVVVELDGRVGHEWTRDRWRDMDRDLEAGARGLLTIRLGWRHVTEESCETARRVVAALRSRGGTVSARPCGPGCPVSYWVCPYW